MQLSPQQLFELKLSFLRELDGQYRQVRPQHEALMQNPNDEESLKALLDFFHRVAGTAEPVGFSVLGRLSAICEDIARLCLQGGIESRQHVASMLSNGLAAVAV